MLVLSRKRGQELVIGDDIRIVINRVSGNRVTIGIQAPQAVSIVRGELSPIVDSFRSESPEGADESARELPVSVK